MNLVLASRSPRRAELLSSAGIEFQIRVADVDEAVIPGEAPLEYVTRLAREKAAAVPASPDEIILGADTTVVIDGQILGKPEDAADASRMLRALSGREHQVITGVCVRRGDDVQAGAVTTTVWFRTMSEAEIAGYVASGEPMDKAGAYGIQGLAAQFIPRIDGSYANVVGLPVHLVCDLLEGL